jgi:tetratricopeptide (TPR) repeat protein
MSLATSDDFGAQYFNSSAELKVHDHMFAAANTAIPHMLGLPEHVNEAHRNFLSGAMRVDIFGLKQGGHINASLTAPLRPEVPVLEPGRQYILETVIRTLKPGHLFTQGTADSNEVWMDVTVSSDGRVIGRSGALAEDGRVDPWSHFANAYVLDRHGNRIDRRNGQDIFVALYNHQIPPGAADVVHYLLEVPKGVKGPVTVEVKLQYRKFDTTYMRYIKGKEFVSNDLPITTLAADRITFPVSLKSNVSELVSSSVDEWERWNDYGIGLLLKGDSGSAKGELRQAEHAFTQVERLARPDGPLNLARVYLKEGRLDEAAKSLHRAAKRNAPPWSVAWFTALVNKQNGFLDEAIEQLKMVVETRFAEARRREFDFSQDYRLLNELGQTLFERAKQERGKQRREAKETLLREAEGWFNRTLAIDPENVAAHHNLALIHASLGESDLAQQHRQLHLKYKPDDNAQERAVAIHRLKNPAADHAAEAVVIYDLQRPGTYGLQSPITRMASQR